MTPGTRGSIVVSERPSDEIPLIEPGHCPQSGHAYQRQADASGHTPPALLPGDRHRGDQCAREGHPDDKERQADPDRRRWLSKSDLVRVRETIDSTNLWSIPLIFEILLERNAGDLFDNEPGERRAVW
jgi:hypothetical protein